MSRLRSVVSTVFDWLIPVPTPEVDTFADDLEEIIRRGGSKLRYYTHMFDSLVTIFRHLVPDRPIIDYSPLPDGSNISDEYAPVWIWFRNWLSLLHRKSLVPKGPTGVDYRLTLHDIANRAKARVDRETQFYPQKMIEQLRRSSDNPDMELFCRLWDELAAVMHADVHHKSLKLSQPSFILQCLILAEREFEGRIRRTHVEDVRLRKRFNIDELDSRQTDDIPKWRQDILRINDAERISFPIRQLRQHGYKRPWDQIFLVIDDNGGQGYRNVIDGVLTFLKRPRPHRALDVLPIRLSSIEDETCAIGCGTHDDRDFDHDDIIILQQCGHYGHQKCLFNAWDVFGLERFSFPCPLCRGDPGRLRAKLEIDIDRANFNPGLDPETEDRNSFGFIQAHLGENWALLEGQATLPRVHRLQALREQTRSLAYAREQDAYYDRLLAGWDGNPDNVDRRRPVHPRMMDTYARTYFMLYGPERDHDPPHYPEAHFGEEAMALLAEGQREEDLSPRHLTALRQLQ